MAAKFAVKNEFPAERCEVCHQSDMFDPATSMCDRGCPVTLDKTASRPSHSQNRSFIERLRIFIRTDSVQFWTTFSSLLFIALIVPYALTQLKSVDPISTRAAINMIKETRIDNAIQISFRSPRFQYLRDWCGWRIINVVTHDVKSHQVFMRDIWLKNWQQVRIFIDAKDIPWVVIHESANAVATVDLHILPLDTHFSDGDLVELLSEDRIYQDGKSIVISHDSQDAR